MFRVRFRFGTNTILRKSSSIDIVCKQLGGVIRYISFIVSLALLGELSRMEHLHAEGLRTCFSWYG